jgi:hypothetical protein
MAAPAAVTTNDENEDDHSCSGSCHRQRREQLHLQLSNDDRNAWLTTTTTRGRAYKVRPKFLSFHYIY